MENPSDVKGKNHGHQPATISLSQEFFGLHAYGGLQENQVSINPTLRPKPPATGLRFAPSEAWPISWSEFGTTPTVGGVAAGGGDEAIRGSFYGWGQGRKGGSGTAAGSHHSIEAAARCGGVE